ncbi:MAG: TonB-dependent receptor [Alphaproteobacteria bacterium]|nr:TonB-dependent receptor [Alphaproteobacteria bacterium]
MSVHNTYNHNTLRRALLVGAAVSALSSATDYAQAQDQGGAAVEMVVVTGSKIARKDADSVGPLMTLTGEDIKNTGSMSIGEILQKLPDAGVSYNSNGTQGTSFGTSSINLRYLANSDGDADRTLVLVDGHRWVDAVGSRGIRDFVDLNTMPIGMIGSVEILQDGASAIYGSDAIAGVVNIHTVQKLDGLSLNAKVGTSSRGDGNEYSGFANWGMSLPHGSIFLSASYVDDQPVLSSSRALTQVSLFNGPNNLSSAPYSPSGLYILPGVLGSAGHPWTQNAGVTVATGTSSYHAAALPGDYYNTMTQGLYDNGPSKRYGFYGRVTNELTNDITFTFDALYNRRLSAQLYGPGTIYIGGTSGTYHGFSIAANQPYNPFGVAFTATTPWSIQIMTPQIGNRNNTQDDDNYRFSAGLDGTVSFLDRQFAWNLFGSYSENDVKFTAPGGVDLERLQLSLNPTLCSAVPGCIPVNIFGQMTPDMANYIGFIGRETNSTQLFDLSADVTGDIAHLPAGPLGMAFGVEYRRVVGHDVPDAYINTVSTGTGLFPLPPTTATTTGSMRSPTANASYNVKEAYIELNIPILADLRFAKSLEADVAERFSDYDSVGSHFTGKVGIGYRPFEDLLLRGTFSQGFRAPSLIELYAGQRQTNLAGNNTDPCSGGAAAHPTWPGCAGVPSFYHQTGLMPETISGNPNLKPETAETLNYGLAWTPQWLQGLSLTTDWYQVTIYNAISQPSATTALQLCATQGGALCDVVQRDPTTGQVLHFFSTYENLNKIRTAGLDTTLRYSFDTRVGAWDAVVSSTYLDRFTTVAPNPAGGAAIVTNLASTSLTTRATYPRWKGQASLRWSNDDFALMWRGRFIGETRDGAPPALPVTPVKNGFVNSITYHDLQADYMFKEHNAQITFGVNNVFDQMPPASYANNPINFDMYTYDIMGRYFYLKLSKDF